LKIPVALLVLCVLGCAHRSPDERILSAFSDSSSQWPFTGDATVRFVAFRDALSARIFKDVTRGGSMQIAPRDQPLYCPGVPGAVNHGYVLGASVMTVNGATAIATVSEWCTRFVSTCPACPSMGGGSMVFNTEYLLQKTNGGWKVVKPLGMNTMIPM
jgi:hypothetical protein